MKYLFNSIIEYVSSEIISNTSKTLGEDKAKLSSAIQISVASLLEVIVEKGEKKNSETILKGMGSSNTLHNISDLFRGNISFQKRRMSSKFLNYLLKDKVSELTSLVASSSHISNRNSREIVFKVSTLVASFLGEKLISRISFSSILEQLEDERVNFQIYIPLEMTQVLEKSSSRPYVTHKLWAFLF